MTLQEYKEWYFEHYHTKPSLKCIESFETLNGIKKIKFKEATQMFEATVKGNTLDELKGNLTQLVAALSGATSVAKSTSQTAPAAGTTKAAMSLDEITAKLTALVDKGLPVKTVIAKFAKGKEKKIANVPPEKYEELLAECEALENEDGGL